VKEERAPGFTAAPEKKEPKPRSIRAWINPAKAVKGNFVPAAKSIEGLTGVPVHRYGKVYVEDAKVNWPMAVFHEKTGTHVSPRSFKAMIEHPDVQFEWLQKGEVEE
jgi:hypothetical protein